MKRVHTNIDLLMEQHNIRSDKELATKLGWKQSAFSQRLSGKLSIDTLESISRYFKVSVKELLR
jgi:transcriptional regulator with XRE-family HTH domain